MAKRILVVDDSPLSRVMISKAVSLEGDYEILVADSGRTAIEMHTDSPADFIFLDLTMPGISGFDVLEELRDTAVPIVVVTADRQKRTAERIMDLGAKAVIPKPPTREMIREVLRSV